MTNSESTLAQVSGQDVDRDESTKVTDVAVIIDRRPAGVHANFVIRNGMELFYLAGKCVVEMKGHSRKGTLILGVREKTGKCLTEKRRAHSPAIPETQWCVYGV